MKGEYDSISTGQLGGVREGVSENGGELGFGAGGEEEAGGNEDGPASERDRFGRVGTDNFDSDR